ncbi:MAG TPA: tetratricopeptide repeat protein, partial [Terriglobia bacterium]|nr:tetratricopeptide repeat protein [Terriglobia bacterium]
MARILILASRSPEREGLTLFMEMVGHQCAQADSIPSASAILSGASYDLVLADAAIAGDSPDQIARLLQGGSPNIRVMVLAEEDPASNGKDEVITSPLAAAPSQPGDYPAVRQGEAFLMLLPERDSLKLLDDLPQMPGLLNKLGLLHQSQQKYLVAEQLYQRALGLAGKNASDRDRNMASILMNLASLYQEQDRLAEAEPLYRRSLELVEKALGANHPKVARRLRRLAELYRAQGRESEAVR